MPSPDNLDVFKLVPPLLAGESAEQFQRLLAEMEEEIKPKGIIEKSYVRDTVCIIWEKLHLQRLKPDIIRNFRGSALAMILYRIKPSLVGLRGKDLRNEAQRLVAGWLGKNGDEAYVLEILAENGLDEGSIDTEAFKLAYEHLERVDDMLMSLEARFSKILRSIAKYRKTLAVQIRASANRILETNVAPEPANDKSAAA